MPKRKLEFWLLCFLFCILYVVLIVHTYHSILSCNRQAFWISWTCLNTCGELGDEQGKWMLNLEPWVNDISVTEAIKAFPPQPKQTCIHDLWEISSKTPAKSIDCLGFLIMRRVLTFWWSDVPACGPSRRPAELGGCKTLAGCTKIGPEARGVERGLNRAVSLLWYVGKAICMENNHVHENNADHVVWVRNGNLGRYSAEFCSDLRRQ